MISLLLTPVFVLMQFISLGLLAYSIHFVRRYTTMTATDARSSILLGFVSLSYGFWLLSMRSGYAPSFDILSPLFLLLTLTYLPFSLGVALTTLGLYKYVSIRRYEPGLRQQATENVSTT